MKNRYLYFGIVILLGFLAISSCKSTASTAAANSKQVELSDPLALENALLWKISGNGLTVPSYLYGTIHMIDKDQYFLPEGTLGAIDESARMIFEIDMNDMTDFTKLIGMMDKLYMKDDLTLEKLLSADDYDMVKRHFEKMGLPMMFFERMKPMILSVFGSGDMQPGDLQSGNIKSYEMEFNEMAKNTNKPTGGLETIEFQMSIFDAIPYEAQANMLVESIKSGDTGGSQFKEMVDIYVKQDLNAMQAMFASEDGGLDGYDDILISSRNKNWIPLMQDMMVKESVFFAVGAGHLGGKEGVIHLLRQKGFKVQPVSNKKKI